MLNNNGAVIKRLSKRSIKASRKRNLVAIVAIILTTFMISAVFSVGVSSFKNLSILNDRLNGTRANVTAGDIPEHRVAEIRRLPGVQALGLCYNVGTWRAEGSSNIDIQLYSLDKEGWEKLMLPAYGNAVGTYPVREDEIMLSRTALEKLGIAEPRLGQRITLSYQSKGYELSGSFTLSGYFDTYLFAQSWGIAYLSESYIESHGLTLERDGSVLVRAAESRKDAIYTRMLAIASGDGSESELPIRYSVSSSKLAEIAVLGMIVLFVVFSGYLLIYNIMYISVTRDIHFYGMLKTIGATSKQLKSLVYRQAGYLMLWGISIGTVLSIIASFVFLPGVLSVVIDGGNPAMPTELSFSPIIYIGTVLFSALTVLISCRKPAKLAGKVSPVEAIKYTAVGEGSKRAERHSSRGGKLHKMAFRNIFRDKKRAFLVFASLFMGVICFLSASCFFGSLDLNNYIERYFPWDFRYDSLPPLSEDKYSSEFMERLGSIDGITKLELIRAAEFSIVCDEEALEPVLRMEHEMFAKTQNISYEQFVSWIKSLAESKQYHTWFYTIPEEDLSVLADKYGEKVDAEAFRRGELCILAYGDYSEMVGRSLEYFAEDGSLKSISIGGVFRSTEECNAGGSSHTVGAPMAVYVSKGFMEKAGAQAFISRIQFSVEKEKEESTRLMLEQLNQTMPSDAFLFSTKHARAEEFSTTIRVCKVLSNSFSLGFILIGIINFFNVMATGIYSRRRELAMLESVGMTKQQTLKMVSFEGAYYALITSLLILTLGNGVIGIVAKLAPMIADYARVVYPFATIVIIIVSIFAICLAVPPLVYRNISKETVTQRLRAVE